MNEQLNVTIKSHANGHKVNYAFTINKCFLDTLLDRYIENAKSATPLRIDNIADDSKEITVISGELLRHSSVMIEEYKEETPVLENEIISGWIG